MKPIIKKSLTDNTTHYVPKLNIGEDWLIDVIDLSNLQLIREQNNVCIFKANWRKYQKVCVKRICVTPDNVLLVNREIDILSKCIHPKVCQYLGAGIKDTYAYMLFEYMSNGNLEDYILKHSLDDDEKMRILLSILVGMNYLSSRTPHKILHRDFKPTNILVDGHGDVKICDFGVSKQLYSVDNLSGNGLKKSLSSSLLISHSLDASPQRDKHDISHTGIGTARWVAPEIVLEDSIYDERCDIYSFGLLAYFVMTNGSVPYFNEFKNNAAQITYAKSMNQRPFIEDERLKLYPNIRNMIIECTEKDPALRPKDANKIIERYLSPKQDTNSVHSSSDSSEIRDFSMSI